MRGPKPPPANQQRARAPGSRRVGALEAVRLLAFLRLLRRRHARAHRRQPLKAVEQRRHARASWRRRRAGGRVALLLRMVERRGSGAKCRGWNTRATKLTILVVEPYRNSTTVTKWCVKAAVRSKAVPAQKLCLRGRRVLVSAPWRTAPPLPSPRPSRPSTAAAARRSPARRPGTRGSGWRQTPGGAPPARIRNYVCWRVCVCARVRVHDADEGAHTSHMK